MSANNDGHLSMSTSYGGTVRPATFMQELAMRAELISVLYARGKAVIFTSPVVALLSVVVLTGKAPMSWLIAWFVLVCLHALARYVLVARYERMRPPPSEALRWGNYMVVATVGAGLLWGLLGLVVFGILPIDTTAWIFVAAVFSGYTAASVSSHAPYLPASYGYLGTLLILCAAGLLIRENDPHVVLAGVAVIYLIVNIVFVRNAHRTLVESIALRFENIYLIEELKQKKVEADEANVAKSKFLAAASHDLRQPLHALTLFVSALDERTRTPEARGILDHINASVDALQKLFNGLLDVSRLDAGVIHPHVVDFPLSRLSERLRKDFEPEAREKGLTFRCEVDDVIVRSDPQLLERILRNYLSNAVRYTRAGEVSLRCRRVDDNVHIEVVDTGKGIPQAQQQDIFREFHQLENPERDRNKGLGLGLAIVERLGKLLGHAIAVESEAGRGSTFRVSMPAGAIDALAKPLPSTIEDAVDLSGMLVLVIDDETSVREGMRLLLGQWGCELLLAGSREDAVAAVRAHGRAPDAVIADYRLRDNDTGVDAIRCVQEESGIDVPALIITGDTAPDRLREAMSSGFQLLHKPIVPAQLRAFLYEAANGVEPVRAHA